MYRVLRILFAVPLLLAFQLARADEVSVFTSSIEQKLSRVGAFVERDQQADKNSEKIVFVDVTTDGLLWRTVGKNATTDQEATAKLYKYIQMASPFPKTPKPLAGYSAIRLAIVYVVLEDTTPAISRVEVKGGFRYVAF